MGDVENYAISYWFHKAIADQEKAKLSIELLTRNAVGIGDHSTEDFHKNLDEALDLLVDSRDRLDTLRERYGEELDGMA